MKIVAVTASTAVVAGVLVLSGFQAAAPAKMNPEQALIAGFKKSTVASVADAVDQITGQRGFMSHDMRPRVPGRDGGPRGHGDFPAAPPDKATPALSAKHSVAMIDNGKPGEVADYCRGKWSRCRRLGRAYGNDREGSWHGRGLD